MIYHILRYRLGNDVSAEEEAEMKRQIESLADGVPNTNSANVYQDLGDPREGFTHSAIITFDGEEEYLSYLVDPFHAKVIEYVIPRFGKIMFCDAGDTFDPGLQERIQQTVSEMEYPPELVEHVARLTA